MKPTDAHANTNLRELERLHVDAASAASAMLASFRFITNKPYTYECPLCFYLHSKIQHHGSRSNPFAVFHFDHCPTQAAMRLILSTRQRLPPPFAAA